MKKFETYNTENEVLTRVRNLEANGFGKKDLWILCLEDIDKEKLDGTPNDTVTAGEKFWSFFTKDEPQEELFRKYGVNDEDVIRYGEFIMQGGYVLMIEVDDDYYLKEDALLLGDDRLETETLEEDYTEHDKEVLLDEQDIPEEDYQPSLSDYTRRNDDGTLKLHEERLNVNKEKEETGEVRLKKDVVTETQTVEVPVEKERVTVTRNTLDEPVEEGFEFTETDEEIKVPIHEEKVTVDKDTVVTEEVEIKKDNVTENITISEDVRKEELQIDDSDVEEIK